MEEEKLKLALLNMNIKINQLQYKKDAKILKIIKKFNEENAILLQGRMNLTDELLNDAILGDSVK